MRLDYLASVGHVAGNEHIWWMSPTPCWAKWINQSNHLLLHALRHKKTLLLLATIHTASCSIHLWSSPIKNQDKDMFCCCETKIEKSGGCHEWNPGLLAWAASALLAWAASALLPLSYNNQTTTSLASYPGSSPAFWHGEEPGYKATTSSHNPLYVLHRWYWMLQTALPAATQNMLLFVFVSWW